MMNWYDLDLKEAYDLIKEVRNELANKENLTWSINKATSRVMEIIESADDYLRDRG